MHQTMKELTPYFIQQRQYPNQGYLPNGAPSGHIPPPTAAPLLPNNGRVTTIGGTRVLCVADVRGVYNPSIISNPSS